MAEFPDKDVDDWRALAAVELKGGAADDLVWETPEGIAIEPLHTAEDLEAPEAEGRGSAKAPRH